MEKPSWSIRSKTWARSGVFSGSGHKPAAARICSRNSLALASQLARDLGGWGVLGEFSVRTSKRRSRAGSSRGSEASKPDSVGLSPAAVSFSIFPAEVAPAASKLPTPAIKFLRDRSCIAAPFAQSRGLRFKGGPSAKLKAKPKKQQTITALALPGNGKLRRLGAG